MPRFISSPHFVFLKANGSGKRFVSDSTLRLSKVGFNVQPSSTHNYTVSTPDGSPTATSILEKSLDRPRLWTYYDRKMRQVEDMETKNFSVPKVPAESLKYIRTIENKQRPLHETLFDFVESRSKTCDASQLVKELAVQMGHKTPTSAIYIDLIHLLSLGGDYLKAQEVFDLMQSSGLVIDNRPRIALMNAYSAGGNLSKTLEMFEELSKSSELPHLYGILAKAYLNNRKIKEAFGVIGLMKEKMTPTIEIYNTIIHKCLDLGDSESAWAAYDKMLEDGRQPNIETYTWLIKAAQKNDLKKALNLFEELLKNRFMPGTRLVNSLLGALVSEPTYYPTAKELVKILFARKAFFRDSTTYLVMVRGAFANKRLVDARYFFFQAQSYLQDHKLLMPMYAILFQTYAVAIKKDLIERHSDPNWSREFSTFDFLNAPPPRYANGCVAEAKEILPFFESTRGSIRDVSWTWVCFLSVLTNCNYFDDAMKCFKDISKRFDQVLHPNAYSSMLEMCGRLQKKSAFFSLLEDTKPFLASTCPKSSSIEGEVSPYKVASFLDSVSSERLYQAIIVGLAEFGRVSEALNFFDNMTKDSAILWENKGYFYEPFYKAVRDSADPDLLSRLDLMMGRKKPKDIKRN